MPAKDMPLQQLKQYTGSTPRPKDFWEFWEKRAGEAWALPLEYELKEAEIPHTPYTQYYDVWLRGMAGARLHIFLYAMPNEILDDFP